MSPSEVAKLWQRDNPERHRKNQRDSYQRRKLKAVGKAIPPNDPEAIRQWWKARHA